MRVRRPAEFVRRTLHAGGGLAVVLCTTCIIPDAGIQLQEVFDNPGVVRIIQPIPITPEADEACADASEVLLRCPVPPGNTVPFGLIDLPQQQFCVCTGRDDNALQPFEIFVEDADLDDEQRPKDQLFGAFLLDVDPLLEGDPSQYVAYENYLPPEVPARNYYLPTGTYADAIERPTPRVRSWSLGLDDPVDLCNDNRGDRLEPGLHEVRLVVTDRPWYVPVELDERGNVQRNRDGTLVRKDEDPWIGVPDLPGGATYDTATYVFRCGNGLGTTEVDSTCSCIQEE
jgi:hypothetical protein